MSVLNDFFLMISRTNITSTFMPPLRNNVAAHMIRTTHLTGTTTNIGLLIGQSFRGNRTNEWRLWILTGLAAAFWTGSLLGYYASRAVHGLALAANAVFFFLIAVALITYFVVVHKISILEALLGVDGGGHCRRGSSASFKRVHIHKETTGEDVSESCLLQMFDDLDKSGLGMVNKDDVLLELAKKHENMKISRCNLRSIMADLFIVVDSDDDWKISREQWAAMVKGTNNRRSCSLVGPTGIRNQSIVVIQADAGFECKEEEQSNKIDVEER